VNSNLNQAQFLSILRALTLDAGRKYDNVVTQAMHLQLLWFTKMDHSVLISCGGGGSYRDFYLELRHGLAWLCFANILIICKTTKCSMCPLSSYIALLLLEVHDDVYIAIRGP
jgi:hypothetical protein